LSPDRELKAGLLETETGVVNRLPQCSEYCDILFFEWYKSISTLTPTTYSEKRHLKVNKQMGFNPAILAFKPQIVLKKVDLSKPNQNE
jgi:hypothetical protein